MYPQTQTEAAPEDDPAISEELAARMPSQTLRSLCTRMELELGAGVTPQTAGM